MTGVREVIIIGGGLAGLSTALYLGRSRRDMLLVHSRRSMAKWEAEVQNCLGFPPEPGFLIVAWSGTQFEVEAAEDEVQSVMTNGKTFQPIE